MVGVRMPRPAPDRERAASARRLLRVRRGGLGGARDGDRAPRLPLRERRRALLARGAAAVPVLVVLVEPGGLAAALAARPERPLGARHLPAPQALARAHAVPGGVPGRRLRVLRVRHQLRRRARSRRSPRCHATAPASCPSLQNPYMLTHPPLLYLGYVGFTIPFAFAMAALVSGRTDGRWLAGRAALDARAVAGARRRHAARRQVGLRGDRLGRLLGLGSGRERRADPVADRHGVPALGDRAGEEGDAQGLERLAGRAHVRALHRRHVPDALRLHLVDPHVRRLERGLVVHRLHRDRRDRGDRRDRAQPRSAALAAPDRLAGLARGDVPVQQPALRGARVRDPLGRPLPVDLRGAGGAPGRDAVALLRLLRRRARPAAAAAGRHRARGRLAPRIAARRRAGLPLAVPLGARGRGRCSSCSASRRASPGVVAISLCLFVTVTIGLELARGTAARRALSPGTSWPAALAQLVGPQPPALRRLRRAPRGRDRRRRDRRHERVRHEPHARARARPDGAVPRLRPQLRGIESPITRSYISTEAVVDVYQGGKRIDTLRPSARTYLDSGEPTKQIAIRPLLHTGEDLYLVFDGSPRPGVVTIKAFVNPLVNLLWLSAIVLVLGFAIAIWPDPRLAARLARRTNEAFARAR